MISLKVIDKDGKELFCQKGKTEIDCVYEDEFSPEYAIKMRDILAEKGVRVSVLGCYINPSETNPETLKASMDYFKECLHYAKYMNADVVGLETGFVGENCDPEKIIRRRLISIF